MSVKNSVLADARSAAAQLVAVADQIQAAARVVSSLNLTYSDADAQAFDPNLTAAQITAAFTQLAGFNTWANGAGVLAALLTFRG